MRTRIVSGEMVEYSRTYRIIFEDCVDYSRNLEYQAALQSAGARVQDFVIDFRSKRIKYLVSIGISWEAFMERMMRTPYGNNITDTWHKKRGVNEL